MPCLILIIFVAFPRIALVLLFLLSNYLERAYHGLLLPLLGFIFLPLTTLAYAWMVNSRAAAGRCESSDSGDRGRGRPGRNRRW